MTKPQEFHKLLRQAAYRARRARPTWLDTEDLTQAAQLALLEAQQKGRAVQNIADPKHAENHLRQRLWGSMMDAIRQAWDGTRTYPQAQALQMPEDAYGVPLDRAPAPDSPMRTLQLKRAVEKFARKGTPKQQEAITLTAAGYNDAEIAIVMGVSQSRVSQLKREARDIMSVWGNL